MVVLIDLHLPCKGSPRSRRVARVDRRVRRAICHERAEGWPSSRGGRVQRDGQGSEKSRRVRVPESPRIGDCDWMRWIGSSQRRPREQQPLKVVDVIASRSCSMMANGSEERRRVRVLRGPSTAISIRMLAKWASR